MTQTHICGHATLTPFEFHWKYNVTSSRGFCLQGGHEKGSLVFDGHWPWAPSAVVKTAIAARKSTSLHLSALLCALFRWTSEGSAICRIGDLSDTKVPVQSDLMLMRDKFEFWWSRQIRIHATRANRTVWFYTRCHCRSLLSRNSLCFVVSL